MMTIETLPTEPTPEPTRALAQVDSWIPVLADVAELAQRIAGTEFVPRGLRDSSPAVAAAILYGREVGLPPMTALSVTHVIEGKPAISAEGMRAMVYAAGHEIEVTESTGAQCIARGRRRGSDHWTTVAWNMDMARAAGVAGKQVWQRYPRAMLQARATAELCRLVFPDVTHGFRAVEELDDTLEDGTPTTPPGPGTKVSRARKTATKKSTPAPLEDREERPAIAGPPLPGEEGYQETSAGGAPADPARSDGSETGPPPAEPQTTDTGPRPVEEEGTEPPTASGNGAAEESAGEGEGEAPEPADSEAPRAPRPRPMTRLQQRGIEAALTDIGVDDDRDERHLIASTILGRKVDSFKSLTIDEAGTLIDTFARVKDQEQLTALLDEFDAQRAQS